MNTDEQKAGGIFWNHTDASLHRHSLSNSTTISTSSDVIICAYDQNPAGSDDGNEWVTFHNPSNESVDIGNWTFESTHGTTAIDWIVEGTTFTLEPIVHTPLIIGGLTIAKKR